MFYVAQDFKKGWGHKSYSGTNKNEAMNSREFTLTESQMAKKDPFWKTRGEYDHSQIDTYKEESDFLNGDEPIKTQIWYCNPK